MTGPREECIIEEARRSMSKASAPGIRILEVRWALRTIHYGAIRAIDSSPDEYHIQRETFSA